MNNYFIIAQTEDGINISEPLSKEEVLRRVEEKYYGNIPILNRMPLMIDSSLYDNGLIIIKGDIVMPKPVQTVTKYDIL